MPVLLTRAGMIAERVTQAFWPFWTVLFFALAPLIMGWQDNLPLEIVWGFGVIAIAALVWALYRGFRQMHWPREAEAIARVDARLSGRPIAALNDIQTIGAGDAASEAVWNAHLLRMEQKTRDAKAVQPDLRVSSKDPYGLRYVAVLCMVVAMLFGSILRVGTVADVAVGGDVLATGPVWEGWIEPPAYTGKPTLYLADIVASRVEVPKGSFITLRLYGDLGALSVAETVSGRTEDLGAATDQQQGFEVTQEGEVAIQGDGGQTWRILLLDDAAPTVELTGPIEADAQGEMSQPFAASDDYGVIAGTATIALDVASLDRRYGLTIDPDPRDPVVIDLPMPFSGDRADFDDVLIDDFSEHPWANLPVTLTFRVEDALGQIGTSETEEITLPGKRFFQPVARAVIEQRRDILWSKANAPRVAQVLRAVSNRPDELFTDETTYLRLRFIIRRLEEMEVAGLTDEVQTEVAEALWELAVQLEEGSLADARARLERAQERLEEAMRNGASDEEIAELMQELREAMNDYMQMLAQDAEPNPNGPDQPDQNSDSNNISQDELQAMMDRIQELMEEGRMAEAMELMEELNELMENLRVTEGEGGEGGPQTPGEQSMEDLAETLRDQQNLSDEAFRELQEQFNQGQQQGQQPGEQEGQQPGQQPGQQGQQPGQQGQDGQGGQAPNGQPQGQGQGDNPQGGPNGENGQAGEGGGGDNPESLAERQQALRDGLNQLRDGLPGLSGDAADSAEQSLDRAEGAMDGAEDALRDGDLAEAIDRQAEALDALRDGLRNLGQALAENQTDQQQEEGQGTQTGNAEGRPEPERRDPLGRELGNNGQFGTEESMLQDDINRRAEELLQELRDRSSEQDRPQLELDYLRRLLDRF
ncbi:MAG: DUF4175 domain-containing protein [Octadecabacter sp.]